MSQELVQEIEKIHERNARVATDKAWEGSKLRRGMIAATTYVVVAAVLFVSGSEHPFIGAIVPPIGYVLSTLTLPVVKNIWIENIYGKK